ncbi:hypothetical protein KHA80_17800 [Anaerobacillus sp. HL2]|nr:hypothetical protein KHA80_17800 [Anaerobacillus sp. HL2]
MKNLKLILLIVTVLFQALAFISFFMNIVAAIYFLAFNALLFSLLIIVIILERIKEKERKMTMIIATTEKIPSMEITEYVFC